MNSGLGRGIGGVARGGMGFGFRGSSLPWPYIGRGRGGLPRCAYYTSNPAVAEPARATSTMSGEEELNYLKNQAKVVKGNLDRINARLQDLESKSE